MLHEEVLSKAEDYHSGVLPKTERSAVDRHLEMCRDCRLLYERWVLAKAPVHFQEKIMNRLGRPLKALPESSGLRRWSLWGTVAAAILAGAAFWHPEKQWMESDKSIAWNERSPSVDFRAPASQDASERGLP
jgi:anti-sigma factor RsiW